jgi:hypothetical protein
MRFAGKVDVLSSAVETASMVKAPKGSRRNFSIGAEPRSLFLWAISSALVGRNEFHRFS